MQVKNKLDELFSVYIRNKGSIDGYNNCYTCKGNFNIKELHAGHYLSRVFTYVRWNEVNVKPQCYNCNINLRGNSVVFRKNLVNEYGEDVISDLEKSKNKLLKLSKYELFEKCQQYLSLNNEH